MGTLARLEEFWLICMGWFGIFGGGKLETIGYNIKVREVWMEAEGKWEC